MKLDRITQIADDVLRSHLGPLGYELVEVEARNDHDDEPALFMQARYRRGSKVPSGAVLSDVLSALHGALQERGEERFPYLYHRFGNDDGYEDVEDESEAVR